MNIKQGIQTLESQSFLVFLIIGGIMSLSLTNAMEEGSRESYQKRSMSKPINDANIDKLNRDLMRLRMKADKSNDEAMRITMDDLAPNIDEVMKEDAERNKFVGIIISNGITNVFIKEGKQEIRD